MFNKHFQWFRSGSQALLKEGLLLLRRGLGGKDLLQSLAILVPIGKHAARDKLMFY